ncbi:MAG TPA: DUF6458 family protein [Gaiellaceae bacterium]|jgi:hypothetical protein|nr:DUF6458 family protein [Gaiellaceae bacterium]
MGVATSLVVLAGGAILAFAVDITTSGVDLQIVGWILMATGALGLVISIAMWESVFGPPRRQKPQQRRRYPGEDEPTRRFDR